QLEALVHRFAVLLGHLQELHIAIDLVGANGTPISLAQERLHDRFEDFFALLGVSLALCAWRPRSAGSRSARTGTGTRTKAAAKAGLRRPILEGQIDLDDVLPQI